MSSKEILDEIGNISKKTSVLEPVRADDKSNKLVKDLIEDLRLMVMDHDRCIKLGLCPED